MKTTHTLLAIAAGLFVTAAHALPEYDHHDPAALNETALQRLKVGDGGTALILLERAHVIFPGDVMIRSNLETLRAYLDNTGSIRLAPIDSDNSRGAIDPSPMPLLPDPWPVK